ncbi:hypothetical protein KY289_036524 [Solanum tuberosum]|nr:hypothetical protein KY289_036524 [Solanum tuberosum]
MASKFRSLRSGRNVLSYMDPPPRTTNGVLRSHCAGKNREQAWSTVPIGVPVKQHIFIDHLKQRIVCEGAVILCNLCGRIGHTHLSCTTTSKPKRQTPNTVHEDIQTQMFKIVKELRDIPPHENPLQIVPFMPEITWYLSD